MFKKISYDNLYHIALNEKELKTFMGKMIISALLSFVIFVLTGFNRFYGMLHNNLLMFIYILEFVCLCLIYSGIFTLLFNNKMLSDRDVDKSIGKFPTNINFLMVLNGLSIALSIIYVIKDGLHNDLKEFIFYLLLNGFMLVLCIYFKKVTKDVYVELNKKEDN